MIDLLKILTQTWMWIVAVGGLGAILYEIFKRK